MSARLIALRPERRSSRQRARAFDYIVLGAGSAGCTLASRLTEDPHCSVLVVEAGQRAAHPYAAVPGAAPLLEASAMDWGYLTIPQQNLMNRRIYWPRGRAFGGSSAINYLMYVRGHRLDYDRWEILGNRGWSYQDVLPYFRKSENNTVFLDDFHGDAGPLIVEHFGDRTLLHEAYLEAAQSVGMCLNEDFNGGEQEGCGYYQRTTKNGRRFHAADAYLDPIEGAPNLSTAAGSLVTRILIEGGRAIGVEYIREGRTIERAYCEREVICCAGAVGSPYLLMLSGIGPASHLRRMGVKVEVDLSGVGQNLMDHFGRALVSFTVQNPEKFGYVAGDPISRAKQFLSDGTGPFTSMHLDAGGFHKTRGDANQPDLQLFFYPGYANDLPGLQGVFVASLAGYACQPKSRGSISLRSADPVIPPLIDPNYLAEPDDLEMLLATHAVHMDMAHAKAFDGIRGRIIQDLPSKPAIVQYVRTYAETCWHPSGTCRMGVDEDAVVDPELKVRGVSGLRVCDASIMPTLVSGNTHAPTVMIAEKGADLLIKGPSPGLPNYVRGEREPPCS
jgi:choline dehydrogenase